MTKLQAICLPSTTPNGTLPSGGQTVNYHYDRIKCFTKSVEKIDHVISHLHNVNIDIPDFTPFLSENLFCFTEEVCVCVCV